MASYKFADKTNNVILPTIQTLQPLFRRTNNSGSKSHSSFGIVGGMFSNDKIATCIFQSAEKSKFYTMFTKILPHIWSTFGKNLKPQILDFIFG